MTNKEVAEYFASLDPGKNAEIHLINGDSMTIREVGLDLTHEYTQDDEYEPDTPYETIDPKKPCIFEKW